MPFGRQKLLVFVCEYVSDVLPISVPVYVMLLTVSTIEMLVNAGKLGMEDVFFDEPDLKFRIYVPVEVT